MELPNWINKIQASERISFLNSYFPGKVLRVTEVNGQTEIHLDWYDDPAFYIDEKLLQNITLLDKELTVYEIPSFYRQYNGFNLVLNDNWTLYFWAQVLRKRRSLNKGLGKLVIIHIDDHFDCMVPLLFQTNSEDFLDPYTNMNVKMDDPDTVIRAINSGSIAIGSFITPFLHALDSFDFRYLIPESRLKGPSRGTIKKSNVSDILFKDRTRPTISFEESSGISAHTFRIATKLDDLLTDISEDAQILVHIDMDYFNNRYDGDSDWKHHVRKHDPNRREVMLSISHVLGLLKTRIVGKQIADFTIAFSPGFFPSDYWQESINLFSRYLAKNDQTPSNRSE
ncbi:hypothetical protein [Pedobacter sp. KBW06]|uniref:hypothetical protein n=1 Tax=Pedobacter sp. KBW06 TaxID=2153359 RepID=UPI000F58F47D|nr:hypothetical protein [Pedobacter sp. KBW06]